MGFYQEQVLPRVIDKVCGAKEIRRLRAEVVAGLRGDVVEIGFGSGLNLPHLPPTVDRVFAVDPAVTGRRLAAGRVRACAAHVEFVGVDGEHLPLADESVDAALSTFTLCTIPDAAHALRELRRVLRPGGELHFLEHGLSPEPRVAAWQHRLTPLQRKVAGGCHLDRPIEQLLTDAGFQVTSMRHRYLKGPKVAGYLYLGTARR